MMRFLTRTLTATLSLLILVLPAMAADAPVQMTNTGEARPIVFEGHDLTSLGDRVDVGAILYAPSEGDNAAFRAEVAACSGAVVDYYDPRVATPDVALLATYDCVLVWGNYAFADSVLYGDNLAAYVDGGGKVILGQWCYHSDQTNWLDGAIMTAAYCPVTVSTSFNNGAYNLDGIDCVHDGVGVYDTSYFDAATVIAGALCDGTFNNALNTLAVAWRADRMVYYSPGNTGGYLGTGDWAQLVCNICECQAGPGPTIAVALDATPDSGVAPFSTVFMAELANLTTENRRVAGRIDAVIANGNFYSNWRAGFTNLSSLENYILSWSQTIPRLATVLGTNTFTLNGEDVTPAPFNQPPFAPSGDTATDVATVIAD